MLPDVWRMADRRARTRSLVAARPPGVIGSVTDGVVHHVAVDAWFHGASVFTGGEIAAREVLGRAGERGSSASSPTSRGSCASTGPCSGGLARKLVLDAVRRFVAAVRPDAHHRAAELHTRQEGFDRARFEVRVDQILDAIARGPWLEGYATASGIVERLEGVRARFGLGALPAGDCETVATGLEPLERAADAGLDAIPGPRILYFQHRRP